MRDGCVMQVRGGVRDRCVIASTDRCVQVHDKCVQVCDR